MSYDYSRRESLRANGWTQESAVIWVSSDRKIVKVFLDDGREIEGYAYRGTTELATERSLVIVEPKKKR
ncbi:MAG: hypothetical protein WC655_13525 [Candidatus Hydrogenedentales bacterium]|jgi:hypothetical protein